MIFGDLRLRQIHLTAELELTQHFLGQEEDESRSLSPLQRVGGTEHEFLVGRLDDRAKREPNRLGKASKSVPSGMK